MTKTSTNVRMFVDKADAWKYAEGRGIRLKVRQPQDAENVIKLVDKKIEF